LTESQNQTAENCNLCGECILTCPLYHVLQKEPAGPRFKAFLAKKKSFSEIFFICTDCNSCIMNCPAKIDIKCLEIRQRLVNAGLDLPQNKVMRSNIKNFGNPFGDVKKGKKIANYYT
jgi:Fe-S oxidoreductase